MARRTGMAMVAAAILLQAGVQAQDRFPAEGGDLRIQPLAHASLRLEHAGRVVYVDPWSRAGLAGAPAADLILVTDADAGAHHLDVAAIQPLRKSSTTVVIPASGRTLVPDGLVLANGASHAIGNLHVEAIGSYDLTPGEPFHARGVANGYVLTMGGLRILLAGVTECVPEIAALQRIDIAFMPMNLPNGRMTPQAVAACVERFTPRVVYPYHYDQGYIPRLAGRGAAGAAAEAEASVRTLATLLAGRAEVRTGRWYPLP